jgi:hypothetical protein
MRLDGIAALPRTSCKVSRPLLQSVSAASGRKPDAARVRWHNWFTAGLQRRYFRRRRIEHRGGGAALAQASA